MSTGGVDERIRAVLDLGDSSGAVKALDAEIQKLLDDFKKQTELFEQKKIAPQAYAESVSKLKSEIGGLHQAMRDLGGAGGAGLDVISSKIFALERGISSLVGGTGLGRAGGLLESGLGLLGGPAGIGALVASIAYTMDQVAPKLKSSWDNMWKQFSAEQVQAKMAELKATGAAMKGEVDAFFTRPVPGTEGMEAERQKKLLTMFNVGTGFGDKNLRIGLLRALKLSQGASPTALSGEEKQELQDIWEKLFPAEAGQKAMDEQGTLGGIIKALEQISEVPAQIWKGKEQYVAELKRQMNQLLERAAARSVSDLLIKLQQGGQPGIQAAEQLKNLIDRFPNLFDTTMKAQIDDLLKLGKQIQLEGAGGPGVGHAAAVYRVPTATDMQREQEIESLEYGRIVRRSARERQQRAMFERDAMQRLMAENPQLKMSDPQHRAILEHQAADEWRMMMGGPSLRSEQEELERDLVRRARTAELIGEHPELTFEEVENQARRETQRRERAIYPERFRRRPQRRPPIRKGAHQVGEAFPSDVFGAPSEPTGQRRQAHIGQGDDLQSNPAIAHALWRERMRKGPVNADVAGSKYYDVVKSYESLKQIQRNTLAAVGHGTNTQEKAQRTVHMLQNRINNMILPRLRALEADADNHGRQAPEVTLPDQVFAPSPPTPAPTPPPPRQPPASALPRRQRETDAQYNVRMYDESGKQIMALGDLQSKALRLEQQGLVNHAKTQEVVDSLQHQIQDLTSYMQLVGRNADNLFKGQQRSQMNTTGNP